MTKRVNTDGNLAALDAYEREQEIIDRENDWKSDKAVDLLSCESDRMVKHLNDEILGSPDYDDEIAEILKLCVKHVDSLPSDIQDVLEKCADKAAKFEHDNQ